MRPGERYGGIAIALHWVMAGLVMCGFAIGLSMVDMPFSPGKLKNYAYHKWIGVTVFTLAAVRLLWRLTHRPPPLPDGMPRWQGALAGAVHALLYALLFAVPLTGWLYSSATGVPTVPFGVAALQLPDLLEKNKEMADLLRFVHRTLNYSFAALVLAHVGAAVGHQLVDDHGILSRMLPGKSR